MALLTLLSFALAADIDVDTLDDAAAPDGLCSLRDAVRSANSDTAVDGCTAGNGADVIVLPAGTVTLALAGGLEDASLTGDLDITGDVTIEGQGSSETTLDGADLDRVFDVLSGTVVIRDLTITGGLAPHDAAITAEALITDQSLLYRHGGGAVRNAGTLTLERVVLSDNATAMGEDVPGDLGLGLADIGEPGGSGAGLLNLPGGTAVVRASHVVDNETGMGGAASYFGIGSLGSGCGSVTNHGSLTLDSTVVTGNRTLPTPGSATVTSGATLCDFATAVIEQSTFTDNQPLVVSLVFAGNPGVVRHSTIVDAFSIGTAVGVELEGSVIVGACPILVTNTTLGGNIVAPGCAASLGPSDLVADPMMGPLADNGGALPSIAPDPGSPAIDFAGTCAFSIDGRGAPRPNNGACDAGAFETGCGNGVLDPVEGCDEGGPTADCSDLCVPLVCGDGILAPDEECDDGVDNSDTDPSACRTDCTDPFCGDGVTDLDEECDDVGQTALCDADCTIAECGDDDLNVLAGEECDAPLADLSDVDPDQCRTSCLLPSCGDDVVDTDETCDDGVDNSDTDPSACRLDCTEHFCGDGITDLDEECDDGVDNGATAPCRLDCTDAFCGDGIVDPGEDCDEGTDNEDVADTCRTDCSDPVCGDGIVDSGEGCDDGALNDDTLAGACRTDCSPSSCGDGVVDPPEECDDGDANATTADACRPDCVLPVCGDGVVDSGEACDDGAANANAPDACRTNCALPTCGDGILDAGEACEGSACNSDCSGAKPNDPCEDGGEDCDTDEPVDTDDTDDTDGDDDTDEPIEGGQKEAEKGGCGGGKSAVWLVLPLALFLRRRQTQRRMSDRSGEEEAYVARRCFLVDRENQLVLELRHFDSIPTPS